MRPISVVTLIILGSNFGITVCLAAVLIVVLFLGEDYPVGEFWPLLKVFGLFAVMTAISALSFYTLIKMHQARYWSQAALWIGLVLTGWYFWI